MKCKHKQVTTNTVAHRFKLCLLLNLLQGETVRIIEHQKNAHLVGGCLERNKHLSKPFAFFSLNS